MTDEKTENSNYRGITLLSIAGKVLARVLLNRLVPIIAEDIILGASVATEPTEARRCSSSANFRSSSEKKRRVFMLLLLTRW